MNRAHTYTYIYIHTHTHPHVTLISISCINALRVLFKKKKKNKKKRWKKGNKHIHAKYFLHIIVLAMSRESIFRRALNLEQRIYCLLIFSTRWNFKLEIRRATRTDNVKELYKNTHIYTRTHTCIYTSKRTSVRWTHTRKQ